MKPERKKLLEIRLQSFLYDLVPVDILPFLSCLSKEDKEQIECDEKLIGPSRATQTLVDRLKRKDNIAFDDFVRALRTTGCDHVAMLLDPQYTVPVNVDKVANNGYTEQFSRVRTIAGTAEDIYISAEIRDEQGNNLTELTKEVAQHFKEAKSQTCRNTRRQFAERLPKGAAFVNTVEGSATFVFRICKVSAAERLWQLYTDDSLGQLIQELIVKQLTTQNGDQVFIKTKLTLEESEYTLLKKKLEESGQAPKQDELRPFCFSQKGEDFEWEDESPEFIVPEVHLQTVNEGPFKELELRSYQKELSRPALQGKNTIICAPTNSGKTYVALGIAKNHLEKRSDGRVIFVVSTVNLVLQQKQRFQIHLPAEYKIGAISGTNSNSSEMPLEVLIRSNKVVILTAQILVNALTEKRMKLSDISMLILDECHHTTKEHPYNMIMAKYMDARLGGNDEPGLPQVVGLTASLGVGKARKAAEAEKHILQVCANMDAEEVVTVTENAHELNEHVSTPQRDIYPVEKPEINVFENIINQTMKNIERFVRRSPVQYEMAPAERAGQQYRHWCESLLNVAETVGNRYVVTYAEQLREYHVALTVNEATRMKDAVAYLRRYFDKLDEKTFTDADRTLLENYKGAMKALDEGVLKYGEPQNPKLQKLKELIIKYHEVESESKGILFSTTRESTIALESWIQECEELKSVLKPKRLVGTADGSDGMTQYEQEAVIKAFRDGNVNIIIATTVAEEGLDISDCNYVIRYDMKGNEISTVQSRGRIRARDGKYSVVVSAKSGGVAREEINSYREMLMVEAIGHVQKMSAEEFTEKVCALQKKSHRDREAKRKVRTAKKLQHDPNDVTFFCKKCGVEACQAHDVRLVGQNYYLVAAEGFEEKIFLKDLENPRLSGVFSQNKKVHCAECDADWGTTVKIEGHPDIPSIKIRSFRLQMSKDEERRQRFNKWSDVTFAIQKAKFEDLVDNNYE